MVFGCSRAGLRNHRHPELVQDVIFVPLVLQTNRTPCFTSSISIRTTTATLRDHKCAFVLQAVVGLLDLLHTAHCLRGGLHLLREAMSSSTHLFESDASNGGAMLCFHDDTSHRLPIMNNRLDGSFWRVSLKVLLVHLDRPEDPQIQLCLECGTLLAEDCCPEARWQFCGAFHERCAGVVGLLFPSEDHNLVAKGEACILVDLCLELACSPPFECPILTVAA